MKLLVTGGTGYLGQYLVKKLAKDGQKIYVLVRRRSLKKYQKSFAEFENVELVLGDITNPDIFDEESVAEKVKSEIEGIVHAAAFYDLEGDYSRSFLFNVVGTQNVLYFSRQCPELQIFHHISTVAVAGDFAGSLYEEVLECGQSFNNHYAKTKYDSELLVRQWETNVKKRIYRLGVLVGDSTNGEIPKVDGPYYFFNLLAKFKKKRNLISKLKFLPLPFEGNSVFPMIPVDHAADHIASGVLQSELSLEPFRCYHVISQQCPTVGQFMHDAMDEFGFKVKVLPLPKNALNKLIMQQIGLPKELLSYMYSGCHYDKGQIEKDFPNMSKSLYSEYKRPLFNFATRKFFGS
ncbi:MAG: NAD-dependent epimerase/dehydratase family protein [Halobacteriovoraceae bacterium]|nr:NAD-dependent epimerase/dehydratase family protein [Halobacteriovoraceae bacterium]